MVGEIAECPERGLRERLESEAELRVALFEGLELIVTESIGDGF